MALTVAPYQSFRDVNNLQVSQPQQPNFRGVTVASPQPLYVQGSSTPIMPSPNARAGVAPPPPSGLPNQGGVLGDIGHYLFSHIADPLYQGMIMTPYHNITNDIQHPSKIFGNQPTGYFLPGKPHNLKNYVLTPQAKSMLMGSVMGGEGDLAASAEGSALKADTSGIPRTVNVKPDTAAPKTSGTLQHVSDMMNAPFKADVTGNATKDLQTGLSAVRAMDSVGQELGNNLKSAITSEYSNDARQGAAHALEGGPEDNVDALNLAEMNKPVLDQAYGIHSQAHPEIEPVEHYFPRYIRQAPKAVGDSVKRMAGGNKTLREALNTESGRQIGREVQKFAKTEGEGPDTLYGTPRTTGLSEVQEGTFETNHGNTRYQPVHTTTNELNKNAPGFRFEEDAGKALPQYYKDAIRVANHDKFGKWLKSNADNFGLTNDSVLPGDYKEFNGIPALKGWAGPGQIVDEVHKELGLQAKGTNPFWRTYDTLTSGAVQATVINPLIHTQNLMQLASSAVGAMSRTGLENLPILTKNLALVTHANRVDLQSLMMDASTRGHVEFQDYGANREGMLSGITHGATKANAKVMSEIDARIRLAAYKTGVDRGMKPAEVGKIINEFMGSNKHMNPAANRVFMFPHYMRTLYTAYKAQLQGIPRGQVGSILTTAASAATIFAMDKVIQNATGNQHAYMTPPGELGPANDLYKMVQGVLQNKGANSAQYNAVLRSSLAVDHINPVFKEFLQQMFDQNLFTGKSISNDRLGDVATTMSGVTPQVMNSNKSAAEKALNLGARIYTPHAPGDIASTKIPALNSKGATADTQAISPGVHDPTGYTQEMMGINFNNKVQAALGNNTNATNAYNLLKSYDTLPKGTKYNNSLSVQDQEKLDMAKVNIIKQLSSNPNALNAYITMKQYNRLPPGVNYKSTQTLQQQMNSQQAEANAFMKLAKNPKDLQAYMDFITSDKNSKGQIVLNGPADTANAWGGLFNHPAALFTRQSQELQNPNHNPEWDLKGSGSLLDGQQANKMVVYAQYKSMTPDKPARDVLLSMNPWINDVNTAIGNYVNKLPKGSSVQGPNYVPYPNIDSGAQAKINTISTLSAIPAQTRTTAQQQQLIQLENDPGVQQAYNQQYAYEADVASQFGMPAPPSMTSPDGGVSTITSLAQQYGLDPTAVLSVAAHEGLSGGVGDNGTSFGPFQLHAGGALPQQVWSQGPQYAQQWAWSPAGISYALQTMANSGAKGLTGQQAIAAIVNNFERPADPGGEINAAAYYYQNPNAISSIAAGNSTIFSPQVQQFMTAYNGASTAQRSAMRSSNPSMYAQMENYMNSQDLVTAQTDLAKSYYGAPLTSSALGAIYNLGNYGISEAPLADGGKGYSLFTATPGNLYNSSSSSSSGSGSYAKGYQYGEEKGISIGKNQEKIATSKPKAFRESEFPKIKSHVAGKKRNIKVRGGSVRLKIPKVKVS